MCMRLRDLADGIVNSSDERMRAARTKWSRLGPREFSAIANRQDLITSVAKHYNLSHAAAVHEVELWDARLRPTQQAPGGAVETDELSL